MPYISNEALVGAGLLVAVAVGYHFIPKATSTSGSSSNKKRKNKTKKRAGTATASLEEDTIPKNPQSATKGKRKDAAASVSASGARTTPGAAPTPSDSSARDGNKSGESAPSFAEVAAPPSSSAQAKKPKTLAEKLAPQPRKTKVDDMLAPEDLPAKHARVMRVTGPDVKVDSSSTSRPAPEQKVAKFEQDYASGSDEETSGTGMSRETDDGWNVVAGKSKPKKNEANGAPASSFASAASSIPGATSDTPTKIQRKNAKKNEAKKAAKAADEAERQRRLNMHKRDLEREKINDLYAPTVKGVQTSKGFGGATVDQNGRLIWE